ncbi:MAG: beta-lactamase family protein [Clostridia bacterium]|nr:beta-lactamase family protein [Clostridia bacterium]
MTLQDSIVFFTEEAHSLSCLSLHCGDRQHLYSALGGVRNAEGDALEADSLFDLASLTKLFTSLLVMRLWEEGLLDLEAKVTQYAPRFVHLEDVTVSQVLGFEIALQSPRRVDAQADRAQGLRELFALTAFANSGSRCYSDMHAMVLKYVIEGAAGETYLEALKKRILAPLSMTEIFGTVPEEKRERCVSCDREHRIEGEKWILREGIVPGTPHDPKAHLLQTAEDVCGHAGLFGTAADLVKLCRGMLEEKIVSDSTLLDMARNRTGHPLPGGGYTQYLGAQCYVRHPQQVHSEVPVYMSDRAIAMGGFTGHHLSVDPKTGIFVVSLGNRVLNRLTVCVPPEGKTIEDYGLLPDGRGQIRWTDGEIIWSSARYVHLKDEHMHAAIMDTLGVPSRVGTK